MDTREFDRTNVLLIASGQVDEVERRLAVNYEEAKESEDQARVLHAVSALAHFYALPFKEDLLRAEQYFRELFQLQRGPEASIELIMFSYYALQDSRKTLEETGRMRSLTDRDRASDLRFLYTAVTIEGQAHLALGQEHDAIRNLEELLEMAEQNPDDVPFGDEFNLVEQITARNLAEPTCKRLLILVRRRVRSVEYREKAEKLLRSRGWHDVQSDATR
jgi:tetratricopeptide (TPR) repeat protein